MRGKQIVWTVGIVIVVVAGYHYYATKKAAK